jgi:hypothetical protein
MLQREYAREALKLGLALEKKLGTNPYKFGMVGATDSHTGLATAEEENFFGKSTSVEPSATRVAHPFVKSKLGAIEGYELAASGYQGVWASENTREAIFDAMERKETYATTGPRIPVRFFGGWVTKDDLRNRAPAFLGYEKGVPMGGDLSNAPKGKAPTFMVYALRDPIGANLDRIQIIKSMPCVTPSAPISTASRSSRAGSIKKARRKSVSTTWQCPTAVRSARTADAKHRSAIRSTWRPRTGPTPSAPPSSPRSGPTRISTRKKKPSTMPG